MTYWKDTRIRSEVCDRVSFLPLNDIAGNLYNLSKPLIPSQSRMIIIITTALSQNSDKV